MNRSCTEEPVDSGLGASHPSGNQIDPLDSAPRARNAALFPQRLPHVENETLPKPAFVEFEGVARRQTALGKTPT